MLTQTLWWSCNGLIAVLLARAAQLGVVRRYLIFYLYLAHVLLFALVRFFFHTFNDGSYLSVYWYTEFVSVAVGYCVIWAIYDQAFAAYPGAIRMASWMIWTLYIVIVGKSLFGALTKAAWVPADTVEELERNLRAAQGLLLVVLMVLLAYYMIPIGRNLRGIIAGYGFFIAVLIINNTMRSYFGLGFQAWWKYSQSAAYLVALLIWTSAMWGYHPNPVPESEVGLEQDVEWISAQTAEALAKARGHILKGVR